MSYKKLDVWILARELVIEVHKLTMLLPKYELYEGGSQLRRSSRSIKSNIVEGYGRKRYKNDFIKFLIYALASADETRDHIETLLDIGTIKDESKINATINKLEILGKKLNNLIRNVESWSK